MSHPFEPTTTEKLKAFLDEYLEENCRSPETNRDVEKTSHLNNRNKLIVLNQILEAYRQRQLES